MNPMSVNTKQKEKQVESNRMLLCGHQTHWNLLLALTWWLVVNNPISFPPSGPQPVFGHARLCFGCETSLRENLRVEREFFWSQGLIEDTPAPHCGNCNLSEMWHNSCQKVERKDLLSWCHHDRQRTHYNRTQYYKVWQKVIYVPLKNKKIASVSVVVTEHFLLSCMNQQSKNKMFRCEIVDQTNPWQGFKD